MKQLVYFIYYIKTLDRKKLLVSLDYAANATSRPKVAILTDVISSVFRYKISLHDYFYFRFYKLSHTERQKWAGTGFMYEFQLRMNPKGVRKVLENKVRFLSHFKFLIRRSFATLTEMQHNRELVKKLLENTSGKLVLKGSHGQVGKEVEVIKAADFDSASLLNYMKAKSYDLVEDFVVQHPDLMLLSPSGLNTFRIITQLDQGQVDFLGARLRISINSVVDNLAAGNLAAPVNMKSGQVNGPGVYSDITKSDEAFHPITGTAIKGFKIPFWPESIEMARQAALHCPENRSVGWDIAITPAGPELIEGNHNWCKLLWQLPVKRGLKHKLEKYF